MLTTERLLIRPVRAVDADALYEIRQRVARWQGRSDRTLDETRTMYAEMEARRPGEQPGWHQYVIEARGGIVGDIGVDFGGPGEQQAELGYSLHPDHWGRGLAAEALAALITHLFDHHRLHRLVGVTGADNARSCALLERIGFRREAHYVEAFYDRDIGAWVDDVGYALLAREWARR